jgi:hypothetical protein
MGRELMGGYEALFGEDVRPDTAVTSVIIARGRVFDDTDIHRP